MIDRPYFLDENHRGEVITSRIRALGLVVFYINECVNYYLYKDMITPEFHLRVSILGGVWFAFAVALWYLVAVRRWYRSFIMYASTTFDMICLAVVVMIGGRDLSQIAVVYYPLIALSSIRYSRGAALYAGGSAAVCYSAAAMFNDLRALGHIDALELVIRVLTMLILSIITGYVVDNGSRLIRKIVSEEVKSERIKDTLARYVSTQVAEEILKDRGGLALKGERRAVTILMSDLRGFTAMSEKIPAEEVVVFLNDYFSRMIDIIFKHRGTLDKFMGDAILAVFGAPVPTSDHAERAARTALEMQEAMAAFNLERRGKGLPEVHMGIGVNSGEVIAGNIGSDKRLEYTVIGDSVNLTQRIEARTGKGEIWISRETLEQVKDLVEVERLSELTVKNREQPVQVYRLIGMRPRK